jgi:hypothetical protein
MENERDLKERQRKDCIDEAIRNWDEFVTPIREKYNIPVYKPKPATIDENGKVKW